MKIHQLIKSTGLRSKRNRIGRGNATGTGNYSGRGLKGQKARSGHGLRAFFEGGQTSIVQRLPKARGFTRDPKFVTSYQVINLGKLNLDKRIADTMEISKASLVELGYIANTKVLVKILGDGEYTKHLTFTDIEAFSASAKAKLEKPGTASKTAGKPYAKIVKGAKKALKKRVERLKGGEVERLKVAAVKKVVPVDAKKVEEPKVIPTKKIETPKAAPIETKKVETIVKTVAKPAAKPVAKPVVKAPAKPATKTVAKPAAKPVAKAPVKKAPAKKAK